MIARYRRLTLGTVGALACARAAPAPTPAPAAPFATAAPAARTSRAALRAEIDSLLDAPAFHSARWGVLVVDPQRGDTLYSRDAGKLFLPASNQKILTGATALAHLGPDYRFRTAIAARGPVRDGVLRGDLVVLGRGDPSASDSLRGDATLPLREIADSLAARGVRRIAGRVASAGDAFPDSIYGAGWAWDDLPYDYGAGVDELTFNDGFTEVLVRAGARGGDPVVVTTHPARSYPPVHVTARTAGRLAAGSGPAGAADTALFETRITLGRDGAALLVAGSIPAGTAWRGTASYPEPKRAFLAALGEALAARAIEVGGAALDTAVRLDTLFTILSPPLREILPAMEKPSQNQIAEVLFRTLALEARGVGSVDSARAIVAEQLRAWGADADGFVSRDGSGLSRENLVTPTTIVRVLDAMRTHPSFDVFYAALPVAGVDGTLKDRMRGTPAEGNVRAKTGTLSGVSSLSGYATTADGQTLVFSILCNQWTAPKEAVRRTQDEIAARLAALSLGAP